MVSTSSSTRRKSKKLDSDTGRTIDLHAFVPPENVDPLLLAGKLRASPQETGAQEPRPPQSTESLARKPEDYGNCQGPRRLELLGTSIAPSGSVVVFRPRPHAVPGGNSSGPSDSIVPRRPVDSMIGDAPINSSRSRKRIFTMIILTVGKHGNRQFEVNDSTLEPMETIDDTVRSCFQRSPYLPLRHVTCGFHNGVLTLWGRVPTFYLKQLAQKLAASVATPDVRSICNELKVDYPDVARDPSRTSPEKACS
jgi:hypothetical protein